VIFTHTRAYAIPQIVIFVDRYPVRLDVHQGQLEPLAHLIHTEIPWEKSLGLVPSPIATETPSSINDSIATSTLQFTRRTTGRKARSWLGGDRITLAIGVSRHSVLSGLEIQLSHYFPCVRSAILERLRDLARRRDNALRYFSYCAPLARSILSIARRSSNSRIATTLDALQIPTLAVGFDDAATSVSAMTTRTQSPNVFGDDGTNGDEELSSRVNAVEATILTERIWSACRTYKP